MGLLLLLTAFTCALGTCSQTDFAPAEIFTRTAEVLEGNTLDLRCAIFHKNEKHRGELHMYLCKNGVGIRIEKLTVEKEKTFKLQDVKKEDTGNYSCVYSVGRHAAHTVTAVGQNYIFVQVKDFGMARIFVDALKGSSLSEGNIVPKGSDIRLKCAAFEAKTQKPLHMYLCKNGIGISMEITQGEEARFTLQNVKRKDSGNYSCVYSIKKSYVHNVTSTNENSVIIQVTEKGETPTDGRPWMLTLIIPALLLCLFGATCYLFRSALKKCLSRSYTSQAEDPDALIYSEAIIFQRNGEPGPCKSNTMETQQTDVIYSQPAHMKAKSKRKSRTSNTIETQQTDVIYSQPARMKAKSKRKSRTRPAYYSNNDWNVRCSFVSVAQKRQSTPAFISKMRRENMKTLHFNKILSLEKL